VSISTAFSGERETLASAGGELRPLMVDQNFAALNKVSTLLVNGHHTVPPRPATWPLSSPLGAGAARLPTISSLDSARRWPNLWRFNTSTRWGPSGSRQRASFSENVSEIVSRSLAVRLLRRSLTPATPRNRIIKERLTDSNLAPKTMGGQWLTENILKTANKGKIVKN